MLTDDDDDDDSLTEREREREREAATVSDFHAKYFEKHTTTIATTTTQNLSV